MTYQLLAKRVIQIALTLLLVLFAWTSYHQFMSTLSMDSMAGHQVSPVSCLTFCFIATKVDVSELTQSVYYSFVETATALLTLLTISVVAYLFLYYVRQHPPISNAQVQRLEWYYHQQRWKVKLFALWSRLYQQGIIAPQVYS
ncbi:MAG: hypothetical protein HY565_00865 [Candidatus Kerfeldbacteria bacterium]|nr:hypothetical protein [Candidatus Kerfeldbacteria bacterium]